MGDWKNVYRRLQPAIPATLRNVGELHIWRHNFLWTSGWIRSRREGMAVAADGSPLPWYTYSSICFLEDRIPANSRIFEFGMGNSTLWWSRRAAQVTTCESDQAWFDRIAPRMPGNVRAVVKPEHSNAYVEAAVDHGQRFDILVLDGRRRVECCRNSLPFLADNGVIIWDNANRERYQEGFEILRSQGFKSIPFWGMTPMNIKEACTSIFYRAENCLGI